VPLRHAVDGPAVWQGDGGALVAAAEQGEELLEGLAADAEDLFPGGSFDLMDGGPGLGRLPDEGEEGDQVLAEFGKEHRGVVWHAHVRVSWGSRTLQWQPHV
jgi:hypothetical protein